MRAPVSDLAASTPRPVIAGKSGETQCRSSRLTWDDVTWKSNRVVSCGQVTAPPPEKRVSGSAARERLKIALSPCSRTRPTASRSVTAGSLTRVARESMSTVNGRRSGVAIRRRAKRASRSESRITRRSPSGPSSMTRPGLARSASSAESRCGHGAKRASRVPGQRDPKGAAVHLHLVEVDQGRRAAPRSLLEAQHLLVVHPAVAVLDELDGGMVELHPAEQDLSGEQVGQPVGHPHAWQIGQQRAGGVPHHQVFERQVVDERARDGADLHLADDDPVQRARDGPRQQVPPRRGQRHRGHHAQHHGHGAEQDDEEEAGHAPPHQNACPTAKWKVNLPFRLST